MGTLLTLTLNDAMHDVIRSIFKELLRVTQVGTPFNPNPK